LVFKEVEIGLLPLDEKNKDVRPPKFLGCRLSFYLFDIHRQPVA